MKDGTCLPMPAACYALKLSLKLVQQNLINFLFVSVGHLNLSLYGTLSCTPNLHLQDHLCECVEDYGPGCSFWTFAFEHLNGILGDMPTNHRLN